MKTYFLVDVLHRKSTGPFMGENALFAHIRRNSGLSNIYDACRSMGVELTQKTELFDLEEQFQKQLTSLGRIAQ